MKAATSLIGHHGKKFVGFIGVEKLEGVIRRANGHYFLLHHNRFCSGGRPDDLNLCGYSHSYCLFEGSTDVLDRWSLKKLRVGERVRMPRSIKSKQPKVIKLNSSYAAEVHKGHVIVGCQQIKNSIILKLAKSLI